MYNNERQQHNIKIHYPWRVSSQPIFTSLGLDSTAIGVADKDLRTPTRVTSSSRHVTANVLRSPRRRWPASDVSFYSWAGVRARPSGGSGRGSGGCLVQGGVATRVGGGRSSGWGGAGRGGCYTNLGLASDLVEWWGSDSRRGRDPKGGVRYH